MSFSRFPLQSRGWPGRGLRRACFARHDDVGDAEGSIRQRRNTRLNNPRLPEVTTVSDEDPFEAEELQRAAEWRLRMVDSDPTDERSAAAAELLVKLADDIRRLRGSPLFQEYLAICNWLGESDGITDFMALANDYRSRIGVDRSPANGEAYLRELINLAKQVFGTA